MTKRPSGLARVSRETHVVETTSCLGGRHGRWCGGDQKPAAEVAAMPSPRAWLTDQQGRQGASGGPTARVGLHPNVVARHQCRPAHRCVERCSPLAMSARRLAAWSGSPYSAWSDGCFAPRRRLSRPQARPVTQTRVPLARTEHPGHERRLSRAVIHVKRARRTVGPASTSGCAATA